MEFFRYHYEKLGGEKLQRVRERLGKPRIVEPKVSLEIKLCINAFNEISGSRAYTGSGLPLPITFAMVSNFHKLYASSVNFWMFKEIIGQIDVYYLDKAYQEYKQKAKVRK